VNLASCDRTIAAGVDVVWDLVSTADGLRRWMAVEAEVELVPGGRITWRHDNGSVVAGEVVEVVPTRRLVFTYGWAEGGFPVPVGSSVVTIELEPDGSGTRVCVRHEGLAPEMVERHTEGWTIFVDRLADVARRPTGAQPPGAQPPAARPTDEETTDEETTDEETTP
jgi:uncharacterized protein YndB with AHSA1/START domain